MTVGQRPLWSFIGGETRAVKVDNSTIRKEPPYDVGFYKELAQKIAELQFRNPSYVLLFRGQGTDYRDEKGSMLRPNIFRTPAQEQPGQHNERVSRRLKRLKAAEDFLVKHYRMEVDRLGNTFVTRYQIVRWSIIQHYEICRTPLLDVSHSLRISTSFAVANDDSDKAYLFVLAVPHISGAVTVCAEEGLQTVRLASVCPPSAIRPHLQEGYLLGEYPEIENFDQKHHYRVAEVDFGKRLVAKFSFNPQTFWDSDFPRVPSSALYPAVDPLLGFAEQIKAHAQSLHPSRV